MEIKIKTIKETNEFELTLFIDSKLITCKQVCCFELDKTVKDLRNIYQTLF